MGADAHGAVATDAVPREMFLERCLPVNKRTLARLNGPAATGFASAPCLPIIDDVISNGTVGVSASTKEDLGQFTYVVSHDLQEPLRTITGFISLLSRRYGEQLDEKAGTYMKYTVDGAARMRRLIEDLLRYSRVGTQVQEHRPVDLNHALQMAQDNLQATLESSGASLTSDELPRVLADDTQVLQLLQNLVGNALKFRGETPPKVHISASLEDGAVHVSVADNGIGMEMEMADRVFKIFQRLHTRGAYEGTGIGLAICKRIVERHGGRIWVRSAPGEGATFHFTLPPA